MQNNETFDVIAGKIFERLAVNFPTPVSLSAGHLFNEPDEVVINATKGTIAYLLHEKLIIAMPSKLSFLLSEKGSEYYLCPTNVQPTVVQLPG